LEKLSESRCHVLSDGFVPPSSVQAGYIGIYEVNKEQEAK
jgi:hypothetical protein